MNLKMLNKLANKIQSGTLTKEQEKKYRSLYEILDFVYEREKDKDLAKILKETGDYNWGICRLFPNV